MRIAAYNVEWFNSLFDDDGQLLVDDHWSGRRDVTRAQQIEALGLVFRAMDADAVMVIEAPDQGRVRDTVRALERFAAAFELRTRKAVMGFANNTQQEIALLYDPDVLSAVHDPQGAPSGEAGAKGAPRFDGVLQIDLDIDAKGDLVQFSKPPLELMVETRGGFIFRMIGAHLKSKAPHGARNAAEATAISIANRRKQLAQSIWLRGRIAAHLEAGAPLMVLGDLNDGPGLDAYEQLFGRSSVEIVMGAGEPEAAQLYDPHAARALAPGQTARATSARFWIRQEERYLQALLDYILVSPDLRSRGGRWRIWHPLDDPGCWAKPALRDALVTASDHFPVTLDIDLGGGGS